MITSDRIRSGWDTSEAKELIRTWKAHQAAIDASATIGPCPNCGAPAEVEMLDASTYSETVFVPGRARCSARCWELDPEGYLEAVDALATTTPERAQTDPKPANPLPDGHFRQKPRRGLWKRLWGE